jgi:tagatose 1,6-diphosphate aldolase GatY/KbaY
MRQSFREMLDHAQHHGYAVVGINIYNLEGIRAVIRAAEVARAPVIIQIHPAAEQAGGAPLIAAALAAADTSSVPVGVHLDHAVEMPLLIRALAHGFSSVMADGSHLSLAENSAFVRAVVASAHTRESGVEAEVGRLSGSEDGLAVSEREARMTDPEQAAQFVRQTGVDALAVCIGNVHGEYQRTPMLDFARLESIRRRVDVPLVLHGASGLSTNLIRESIRLGICKINVNTEVRAAYKSAVAVWCAEGQPGDIIDLQGRVEAAMCAVVMEKIRLTGSEGRAQPSQTG